MDQSYFVDWQKAKVQENPDEVRWVGRLCRMKDLPHASAASLLEVALAVLLLRPASSRDATLGLGSLGRGPDPCSLTPPSPQVPAGSLPRTMEVILRNDQVETVRPGDKAVFTGMLVVVPDVAALT